MISRNLEPQHGCRFFRGAWWGLGFTALAWGLIAAAWAWCPS